MKTHNPQNERIKRAYFTRVSVERRRRWSMSFAQSPVGPTGAIVPPPPPLVIGQLSLLLMMSSICSHLAASLTRVH